MQNVEDSQNAKINDFASTNIRVRELLLSLMVPQEGCVV